MLRSILSETPKPQLSNDILRFIIAALEQKLELEQCSNVNPWSHILDKNGEITLKREMWDKRWLMIEKPFFSKTRKNYIYYIIFCKNGFWIISHPISHISESISHISEAISHISAFEVKNHAIWRF